MQTASGLGIEEIELVKRLVVSTGCVPLLGHGVLFPELRVPSPAPRRPACALACAGSLTALRAYLQLALLGKRDPRNPDRSFFGPGAEKFFGGFFVDWCLAWFEQRADEMRRADPVDRSALALLEGIKPRHRWRPLLEALAQIAESAPGLTDAQRLTVRHEWHAEAEQRLSELVKKRRGKARRTPLGSRHGLHLRPDDSRWDAADAVLAGDGLGSGMAQAAYFLHVFHASLGLMQPHLDDSKGSTNPNQARRQIFNRRLLELLRAACRDEWLRQSASRIAAALVHAPQYSGVPIAPGSAAAVAIEQLAQLPEAFRPSEGLAPPSAAEAALLPTSAIARELATQAHLLAEMLADQMLDALRMRRSARDGPGFDDDCYMWACSRYSYRRQIHAKAAKAMFDDAAAGAADRSASSAGPSSAGPGDFELMLEAYFKQLREPHIGQLLQLHGGDLHRADWQQVLAGGDGCAVCHVQMAAGRST